MSSVKVSRGGFVTDRETGAELGWVRREEWVSEVDDPSTGGRMIRFEQVWEARRPHQIFEMGSFLPTFDTRREAVAFLAQH